MLKSHQRRCYFDIFLKFLPVSYWAAAIPAASTKVTTMIIARQAGQTSSTVRASDLRADCKQGKVVRGVMLGVDLTGKLRIIFQSKCHAQLRSLKEIIKSPSQWIK